MTIKADEQYWSKFKLLNLKGKKYLQVSDRLIALRELDPTATVTTECLNLDVERNFAFFKATVILSDGRIATGHGSETAKDFGDYIEKAETKAIGRALTLVGIGVQYAADEDFSFEGRKLETARTDFPGVDSGTDSGIVKSAKTENVVVTMVANEQDNGLTHDQLEELYKVEVQRVGPGALVRYCTTNFTGLTESGESKDRWHRLNLDERRQLIGWSRKQPSRKQTKDAVDAALAEEK